MGEKERKGRKKMWEKGKRIRNGSKKEGNYPYFISLFDIGLYDRQKSPHKTGKN